MQTKKIVIASDSFKGTLSSSDICQLFNNEFKTHKNFNPVYVPIADGGEGSLDAVSKSIDGRFVEVEVKDLYFQKLITHFYIDKNNNAYIEAASCVGLGLARNDNDPGLVTTYGLGEQIKEAIRLGVHNIYIFLGGSASNDGGVGLASALGTKFFDKDNNEFIPTGLTLKNIVRIDNLKANELLKKRNIVALCDVKSPLFGIEGAAYKFAPQKGASKEEIKELDDNLRHLSQVINKDLNKDISLVPGSGAAGGLGAGLLAFAHAKIVSGIDALLDLIHFDEIISDADYVISGEGKLDRQTLDGKVIDGIAKRCEKHHKPLIVVVGISEIDLVDAQKTYPAIKILYETNYKHLPFEAVKGTAKEDYIVQIKQLLNDSDILPPLN